MENIKTTDIGNADVWVKPEIKISQIKEETLGNGGGGFDFGSEVSA